jgi:hypothetical protein
LPSTKSVFGLLGRLRTTPSKDAPSSGASIVTLFAYGKAPSAFLGKIALRKSSAGLLALIAEMLPPLSSKSSGVRGGVTVSIGSTGERLLRISRGGVENGRPRRISPEASSHGGVGGRDEESLKLSEPNEDSVERSEGEEGKYGVRLSVTQSDDPLSGGHFTLGMSKTPLTQTLG